MVARKGGAWLLRLSGPLLLLILLIRLDLDQVGSLLGRLEATAWLLACLCCLPILPLRAWRWFLLLEHRRPPFGQVLTVYAHSVLLGTVTPGGLGEMGKALYLKSRQYGTGFAIWVTLWDRILDLIVLGVVAFVFVWAMTVIPLANLVLIGTLSAAVACCIVAPWGKTLRLRLGRILGFTQNRLGDRGPGRYFPASSWSGLALSAAAWCLNWIAVWILAGAMGLALSPMMIAGLMACVVLAGLAPVTVLGLGTRDVTLLYFLLPLGFPHSEILALSLAVLVLRLGYALICLFFLWFGAAPSALDPLPETGRKPGAQRLERNALVRPIARSGPWPDSRSR